MNRVTLLFYQNPFDSWIDLFSLKYVMKSHSGKEKISYEIILETTVELEKDVEKKRVLLFHGRVQRPHQKGFR